EVISIAAATGARAQLAHLTSSTVGSAPLCIRLIEGAARHGVNVGFDLHVWTRNETTLQSALYDEGWQERFGGVSYEQIYVSDTQEQLTKARFEELRKEKEPLDVQTEFIKEEEIELALRSPMGIISSDGGGLDGGKGHPRSVGTFARFLRLYVREKQALTLLEGLRRITLLPAQRLEESVPRMKRKGRLQAGCDADITVFDPARIGERATYKEPALLSDGVRFVVVNGVLALDQGKAVEGVAPGQWLRHTCAGESSSGHWNFPSDKTAYDASQSGFYFCPALRRVARAAALASRAAAGNKRDQIRARPLRHGGDGLALRHLRRRADAGSRRECDGRGGGGAFGADGG